MRRALGALIALAVVLAACGSDKPDGFAQIASSNGNIGVGEQRVLIAIIDRSTDQFLAAPDLGATATLSDRIGSPIGEYEGDFIWIVPDVRGLYAFNMDIPGPGTYQVTVSSEGFNDAGPVGLVTVEDPTVVSIGDEAPRSVTRTSATHDIGDITSDPSPDPSFYELSLDEAIDSGPTAIVFGTPAWCSSQACGPLLDQVKALSADYPDLNYVHVEVYEDIHVSSFQDLTLVEAVAEWALPAEPWVFVTDAGGIVTASFEGVASDAELAAAFAAVSP